MKKISYKDVEPAFAHIISVLLTRVSEAQQVSKTKVKEEAGHAWACTLAIKEIDEHVGFDSKGEIKRNCYVVAKVLQMYTGDKFETDENANTCA